MHSKIVLWLSLCSLALSQSLEPRLHSNAPTAMNFLVLGIAHTQGSIANIEALGLSDADLGVDMGVLAYARYFNLSSKSAKIDLIIPYAKIDGTALRNGSSASRKVDGLGDIKARISVNIFGAPALSLKEFASYKQDTIVGVSLQVTMPTGQYDATKLVNLSPQRWAIKSGIGISQVLNDFILELSADAEFYTQNKAVLTELVSGGFRVHQAGVYSTQMHIIYNFMPGLWMGVDANYYFGGASSTNDGSYVNELSNTRFGATLALPINRYNSIKLYANSGVVTRVGTDFDLYGLMWQIRFSD